MSALALITAAYGVLRPFIILTIKTSLGVPAGGLPASSPRSTPKPCLLPLLTWKAGVSGPQHNSRQHLLAPVESEPTGQSSPQPTQIWAQSWDSLPSQQTPFPSTHPSSSRLLSPYHTPILFYFCARHITLNT